MSVKRFKFAHTVITAIALACMVAVPAHARRGGSFGSRGSRTYLAPRETSITSRQVAPVQRSMTQPSANGAEAAGNQWRSQSYGTPAYAQPQPARRFGGFGGGLIGGLIAGGLIGSMMGHGGWGMGYGGMGGGLIISLIQLMILGGLIWFVVGLFRRRTEPSNQNFFPQNASPFSAGQGVTGQAGWTSAAPAQPMIDISITDSDKTAFEGLLGEVQAAFGREDYGRLRELTTPEIMSFLSEELSQNATSGRRNEVSATRLIDAEVSEAWREGNVEYATIAMRYESIDFMRDRASGVVISGDPNHPTETTEVWTFIRPVSGTWKLSAIQE
jgi:predicted lipid-binding transport protein (Tim44 family)